MIVIIFLSESIVALKSISVPFSSVSFRVMRPSTLLLVKAVSLVFLSASLKVMVILSVTGTRVSESTGLKVSVGEIVSIAVKVAELAVNALSYKSSTVEPIAT